VEQQIILAGRLTLRPFTAADPGWVHEVSLGPALQQYVGCRHRTGASTPTSSSARWPWTAGPAALPGELTPDG
jgi:hypothetical protein